MDLLLLSGVQVCHLSRYDGSTEGQVIFDESAL